ncbi:hypothetical protein PV327_008581 [Microctonus hyperodae]|uniref:Uncharacterized protein n=1 Tax=Microctonus hyperodae TaxID=165561 RepID=A0AA39F3F0_MICHY|nr:hypothetical protein PV327_008581 [Microctonus hyperodae]
MNIKMKQEHQSVISWLMHLLFESFVQHQNVSQTVLVVIKAAVIPAPGPAVVPVFAKLEHYDPNPQYTFAYDVQDALTGDSKAQYETRNGDVVQGSYSLIEPDGTRRIVDYTADPINGFNAVVNREPAVAVAPVITRTAIPAAPIAPIPAGKFVATPVRPIAAPINAAPIIAKVPTPINPAPIARITAPLTYAAATGYRYY